MIRKALVVGINRYPFLRDAKNNSQNLTFPAIDGNKIAQCLREYGHFEVKLLPEILSGDKLEIYNMGKVKQKILIKEISTLFNPQDRIYPQTALLYFSGHGLLKSLSNDKKEGYLACSDSNKRKDRYGISFNWLSEVLINSPISELIVWLDCYHSGDFINSISKKISFNNVLQNHKKIWFIASCQAEETTYGLNGYRLFTQFLLEGLNPYQNNAREWINSKTLDALINEQLKNDSNLSTFGQRFFSITFGKPIYFWQKLGTNEVSKEYIFLQNLLALAQWKEANKLTRKIILEVVKREKEGWLTDEQLLNFPWEVLETINQLWLKHSDGYFGFSVQKQIFNECGKDIKVFGENIGWYINRNWISTNQVNYSLKDAKKGHLPWGIIGVATADNVALDTFVGGLRTVTKKTIKQDWQKQFLADFMAFGSLLQGENFDKEQFKRDLDYEISHDEAWWEGNRLEELKLRKLFLLLESCSKF